MAIIHSLCARSHCFTAATRSVSETLYAPGCVCMNSQMRKEHPIIHNYNSINARLQFCNHLHGKWRCKAAQQRRPFCRHYAPFECNGTVKGTRDFKQFICVFVLLFGALLGVLPASHLIIARVTDSTWQCICLKKLQVFSGAG